jgi:hypothetical protein
MLDINSIPGISSAHISDQIALADIDVMGNIQTITGVNVETVADSASFPGTVVSMAAEYE